MRLYLASSFTRANDVGWLAAALEDEGHEIPDRWWGKNADRYADKTNDSDWHGQAEIRALEARHWRTIKETDALVLVANMTGDGTRQKFTGANVEVGYALALGKPVVIVGAAKRSAMYAGCIHVSGPPELLRILAILDQDDRAPMVRKAEQTTVPATEDAGGGDDVAGGVS